MIIVPAVRPSCGRHLVLALAVMITGSRVSWAADNAQTQCVQDLQAMGVSIPGISGAAGIETLCRCQNDALRAAGINPDDLHKRTTDDLTKLMGDMKGLSADVRTKVISSSAYMKDMQIRSNAQAACIVKLAAPVPPAPPPGKQK